MADKLTNKMIENQIKNGTQISTDVSDKRG